MGIDQWFVSRGRSVGRQGTCRGKNASRSCVQADEASRWGRLSFDLISQICSKCDKETILHLRCVNTYWCETISFHVERVHLSNFSLRFGKSFAELIEKTARKFANVRT